MDDTHFSVTAKVEISDQFFGWILDFGKKAKLLYPVTEVNIPASVKSIDFQVAVGMEYLERFNVSPESKYFVEVDGCVYSSDMKTLIIYPPAKACNCFEIPSTVESIAPGAFWGVCDLKSVKVGKNVKRIGYEAFTGSLCIERIYIDESVEEISRLSDTVLQSAIM